MRQAIIWTNADPIHGRIYASIGGEELIKVRALISNDYLHSFLWVVIIHPCYNFNGGLIKPPLKLRYGWVNTSYTYMWLNIYCHNPDSGLTDFFLVKEAP